MCAYDEHTVLVVPRPFHFRDYVMVGIGQIGEGLSLRRATHGTEPSFDIVRGSVELRNIAITPPPYSFRKERYRLDKVISDVFHSFKGYNYYKTLCSETNGREGIPQILSKG
jgi:hypothetical protein